MRTALALSLVFALAPALAHAEGTPDAQPAPPPPVTQPAPPPGQAPVTTITAPPPPGYAPAPVYAPGMVYGVPGQPVGRMPLGFRRSEVEYNGGPIPPNGRLRHHHPIAAIVVGGAAFLVGELAAALVWDFSGLSSLYGGSYTYDSAWMVVPIVGPWIALTDTYTRNRESGFLVVDGILQDAGIALLLFGVLHSHTTVVINEPVYGRRHTSPLAAWAVTPAIGYTGINFAAAF